MIPEGSKFPIQPNDINIDHKNGFTHLWEAFENSETEASAYWIVKLSQKLGGWIPFTEEQIEAVYKEAGHHHGFLFNRLVNPEMVPPSLARAFAGHVDPLIPKGGGWIVLGDDKKYYVTDEFVSRCFKSSPVCPEKLTTAV